MEAGSAPPAEPTQPADAGEGGQAPGSDPTGSPWDLNAAPAELRPYLEAELKKYEGNITRKFQEAADYRKQWEPYETAGVNQVAPEELAELLQLREVFSDEDAFKEWWQSVGSELGYEGQPDPGAEDPFVADPDAGPNTEEIEAQVQQQSDQQRVAEAQTQIDQQLAQLKAEHGEFNEDAVCQLALAYDGAPDSITNAYADYQRLVGQAENGLVSGKMGQPDTPESGGGNAPPEPITSFADAKTAALARMRS